MIKKSLFFAAFVSLALATSCSQEDLLASKLTSKEIGVNPSMGLKTRAVETTISNLGSFKVTAFQEGKSNYMNAVKYTSADGSAWTTDAGRFFWPVEGDLHFYAYAPDAPGQAGELRLDKDAQALTDFVPNTAASDQKDFVYAKSTGSAAQNGETGIDVNFQHALSEITIDAKNDNTAYTVEVTGVKLGNVITKGSFTFPSPSDAAASWTLSNETSDVGSYTTTWTAATTLGSSVSTLDATNVPFMIIPQQLAKADKASEKAYIALKVKITMQGGIVIHDGWSYVGIDTNWEMGKKYAYTLDFSKGAGQDENGKQIISGTTVNLNCAVTDWDGKSVDVPERTIFGGQFDANSIMMKTEKGYYYGIDITRANTFWSNSVVGNASNVIDDNTQWTAEVIWQDIPSRAINFCDDKGNTLSGDTYEGTGKAPLYVKSAGSTPGNVVIGIKKKGSSDYLWSWHLWITEEPQEVGGFMDRNLGATSATPSDGSKTYGLYYQFGRKDPFVANVDIYDINGTKLQTGKTIGSGKVTFAKAVNTPGTFYKYNGNTGDWASPNNYTEKRWNDITGASGKTFFDPCPPGWKLPKTSAFSGFSDATFTWDATNKGRTYQANWFPTAGTQDYSNGGVADFGSIGVYWSESPIDGSFGYGMNFFSGIVNRKTYNDRRANGFSVRCVQE